MKKKNVVIIGGGNGSAIVINALKKHVSDFNLTALVSMSDSGGSTGKLRAEFKTLPPGDIMRAVVSLSRYDYHRVLKPIFYRNRFTVPGKLEKHNLGNLFLILASQYAGNFEQALAALHQAIEAVGTALPVTLLPNDLCVSLTNGQVIKTEAKIDEPDYDRKLKIAKAWLEPSAPLNPKARQAIQEANVIVLCPGSVYTSVVAALLPAGLKAEIAKSSAQIVYIVGNAYEQGGETGPENLSGIVKVVESYLPRPVDVILFNNHKLTPQQKKNYQAKNWGTFENDLSKLDKHKIVKADFETKLGGLSPDKLRAPLLKIIK